MKFIAIPPEVEWTKAVSKIELEVAELQKLKHPNLVSVYGAGVHDDRIFFATELVEGESLSAILSRRGKITPDLVVEYGRQLADVLRYLHQQDLIHSKLTPEKIIVTEEHKVKIADLRLNRSKRRRWDSRRRRELDIAAYMAPEQFTEGATQKSDFYALGVILFEMLTGKLPYEPDTMGRMTRMKTESPVPSAAEHVMNCPIWLDKIVSKMLQPNPRKRPHTAREIVMGLEEIKKIASTKQAAVAQMTGGFSALNAGVDKTEARRLLGKKTKPDTPDVSFFQSVPFMVGSLVAILALVIFMALPKSNGKRIDEARALLKSADFNDWNEAKILVRPIMDSYSQSAGSKSDSENPESEAAKRGREASEIYFEAQRLSLVRQAKRGIVNRLQSENVQLFGKAVRLQQDGREEEASNIFQLLVKSISPTGEERHVYAESKQRLVSIKTETKIPTDPTSLRKLIQEVSQSTSKPDLVAATETLGKIVLTYAGESEYQETVTFAKMKLDEVKKRLAKLAESVSEQGTEKPATDKKEAAPPATDDGSGT